MKSSIVRMDESHDDREDRHAPMLTRRKPGNNMCRVSSRRGQLISPCGREADRISGASTLIRLLSAEKNNYFSPTPSLFFSAQNCIYFPSIHRCGWSDHSTLISSFNPFCEHFRFTMPRSKRAKVVHESKTAKKSHKEQTRRLYANIREAVEKYEHLFVFDVNNMRNTYLKDVRTEFADSR